MTYGGEKMIKNRQVILAGIIIIALLSTTGTVVARGNNLATATGSGTSSDIDAPDNRQIGPESPLFGLKVAMEDLDETFTFNDTRRLEKQAGHAQTRIEEVSRELELNQGGYAETALELYSRKLNQTEMSLPRFQSDAAGLLHVQELIARHQSVLTDLLSRYPGSTGLVRAYDNNLVLEQKFGEKTRVRFERGADKNNKTVLKAVKLETGKPNNSGAGNSGNTAQGKNESQGQVKDKKNDTPVSPAVIPVHTTPANDKGSSRDQGKKGRS
jgi:hypothetical protein